MFSFVARTNILVLFTQIGLNLFHGSCALIMVNKYPRSPFRAVPSPAAVCGKVAFTVLTHAVARVMDQFPGLISHIYASHQPLKAV